jgi:hypothetical protein
MKAGGMMTSAEPNETESQDSSSEAEVPSASPAYSTPPPEGLPDADDE